MSWLSEILKKTGIEKQAKDLAITLLKGEIKKVLSRMKTSELIEIYDAVDELLEMRAQELDEKEFGLKP